MGPLGLIWSQACLGTVVPKRPYSSCFTRHGGRKWNSNCLSVSWIQGKKMTKSPDSMLWAEGWVKSSQKEAGPRRVNAQRVQLSYWRGHSSFQNRGNSLTIFNLTREIAWKLILRNSLKKPRFHSIISNLSFAVFSLRMWGALGWFPASRWLVIP